MFSSISLKNCRFEKSFCSIFKSYGSPCVFVSQTRFSGMLGSILSMNSLSNANITAPPSFSVTNTFLDCVFSSIRNGNDVCFIRNSGMSIYFYRCGFYYCYGNICGMAPGYNFTSKFLCIHNCDGPNHPGYHFPSDGNAILYVFMNYTIEYLSSKQTSASQYGGSYVGSRNDFNFFYNNATNNGRSSINSGFSFLKAPTSCFKYQYNIIHQCIGTVLFKSDVATTIGFSYCNMMNNTATSTFMSFISGGVVFDNIVYYHNTCPSIAPTNNGKSVSFSNSVFDISQPIIPSMSFSGNCQYSTQGQLISVPTFHSVLCFALGSFPPSYSDVPFRTIKGSFFVFIVSLLNLNTV